MFVPDLVNIVLIDLLFVTRIHNKYTMLILLRPFKLGQNSSRVKVISKAYLHIPHTWTFIFSFVYKYYSMLFLVLLGITFTFHEFFRHVNVAFLVIIVYQRYLIQTINLYHYLVYIVYNKFLKERILRLILFVVYHDVHVVSRTNLAEFEL